MATVSADTSLSATVAADPLLQPFQLRHLRLRNRIMSTSHACGLEEGGMPKERYQRYHEEKAIGGIALSMFGGSSNVAPDSPNIFRQLNVGTEEIVPWLREFAERMHEHGTALMCQITHLGRRGDPYADNWLPTIGPSVVRETMHRSFPKEMDEHDIARVVHAYGAAAKRCQDGGLDGIETLAGGHLIGQFLSPATNRRGDRFGGSLENRCRFGLMVFEEIRRQVGEGFLVGFRFVVDEGGGPDTLTFEDCVDIAHRFERTGLIDFFNAIYGRMDTELALATHNMPGMASPLAPWLQPVGAFKREVGLPVFHAARISDIATARHAVREGVVDMVGMTRAHIADPHIVSKLRQGREGDIRPCVGATHCQSGYRPSCLHNPATGRETTLAHRIEPSTYPGRRIVVIGGGPAGLEAARVAAERGHHVTLFEAAGQPGGQVLMATRAAWRRDLRGIIDWRLHELDRLGVSVHFNHFADAADALAVTPNVIIIATGGTPDLNWLEGSEHATSSWDALSGAVPLGGEIIVYDGTGRHPAPQAADLASNEGHVVSLVSIDGEVAKELTYVERIIWKKRLYEQEIPILFDYRLEKLERKGNHIAATFRNLLTDATLARNADQVVVEHGTVPAEELFHHLRSLSVNDGVTDIAALLAGTPQPWNSAGTDRFALYRIGDAVASRNVHTAVLDALRLCCTL